MNVREALTLASHLATSRSTLPILSHLRIQGGYVTACDLDRQLEIPVELPPTLAGEAFCVHGARLVKILKGLPESAELEFTRTGKQIGLRADGTRYRLNTLPAEDFPTIAPDEDAPMRFSVDSEKLIAALKFVAPAMAVADVRYYLNGFFLRGEHSRLVVVATDGYRLHRTRIDLEDTAAFDGAIVHRDAVARVIEIAERHPTVELGVSSTQFSVTDRETLVTKLIEGTFPDIARVIPSTRPVSGSVLRKSLINACKRLEPIYQAADKFHGVLCSFTAEAINLQAANKDGEEAETTVAWETPPKGMATLETAFQIGYLSDAANAFTGDAIFLHLGQTDQESLYMTDAAEGKSEIVLMPTRI